MTTVSSLGVGAGFDLASVLDALMANERKPLDRIEAKQATVESKLSLLGKIKSDLSSFKLSLSALRYSYNINGRSASSSDTSVLTATSNPETVASSYSVNVTSIATVGKEASSAYTDATTDIGGSGTLTISVGSNSFDIAVAAGATLSDIRDAINAASDNTGVSANTINESTGSRLILTGTETGAANAITFSVADDDGNNTDTSGLSRLFSYGVGGDGLAESVTTAADAVFSVDGFAMTSATNSVSTAVDNLTFDLKGAGSSTITVDSDSASLETQLQDVVDAYNKLRTTLDDAQAGAFKNDSVLNSIRNGLNSVLNTAAGSGTFTYLSQIGVSRDRYGVLSLDTSRLSNAVSTDFDSVVNLLSDSSTGFANRLYTVADSMLSDSGYVGGRETSLYNEKSYLATQNDTWTWRLDQIRKRYQAKFTKLDTVVSGLQSTNSFLSFQTSQLR